MPRSRRSEVQDHEVSRVRFRRALALMLMTLVLPGSAQLVMGNRRVARIALAVWFGAAATFVGVVSLGLLDHAIGIRLAASTGFLAVLRLVLAGLAVGWALLFIDAWRLGEPLGLAQRQRLAAVGLNGLLVFAVAGSLLFASHLVGVQRDFINATFAGSSTSDAQHGRYNVLLVGGDSGSDRTGLRADSLTVASIDEETGKTILFGLPRNMTNFPFPKGSVMRKAFPNGYNCAECELNSLATYAGDHLADFADFEDPQLEATIQGVEGITGLKINYYAMVNLGGFKSLVTAMGGLTLNVRDDIPIGGGEQGQIGTIKAGVRKLNGYEVLWFARSRMAADDYSRMARQKCVMSAMVTQLSPQKVLTRFEKLAKAGESVLETNLPASELDTFVQLALKARTQKIASVSFVPPAINTGNPDIAKIQTMIETAVARSDGSEATSSKRSGAKRKGFTTGSSGVSVGGSIGTMTDGYAANESANLANAC